VLPEASPGRMSGNRCWLTGMSAAHTLPTWRPVSERAGCCWLAANQSVQHCSHLLDGDPLKAFHPPVRWFLKKKTEGPARTLSLKWKAANPDSAAAVRAREQLSQRTHASGYDGVASADTQNAYEGARELERQSSGKRSQLIHTASNAGMCLRVRS
jgi:hypothetical protein